jgi:hypothetical protein
MQMTLLLKGGEFLSTGPLNSRTLMGLMRLARRSPILLNGVRLCEQDLARLAEDAEERGRSGRCEDQASIIQQV